MLPRHEAQPSRKMPCALKGTDIVAYRGSDQGSRDRPDARNRGQAPCRRILARMADDLLFERRQALDDRAAMRMQLSQDLLACCWDAFVRVDQGHQHLELV